jgi:AcrR family transcriptional regulator
MRSGWTPSVKHTRGQRARVAEFQRSRLLKAAVQVASERGYDGMSVTAVVAGARVSSKTFYEFFDGREDCCLAVCEECLTEIACVVGAAYDAQGAWRERLRAALTAALEFLEAEREMGTLALAYLLGAGPKSQGPRARALEMVHTVLEDGRSEAAHALAVSPLAGEILVGGMVTVIHARLSGREGSLVGLVNPLMSMMVLPYLGAKAAAGEMKRTPPKVCETPRGSAGDPLKELGIRLTYRTAQVLAAVAEAPGLSNAEISVLAGIKDQGQISKLLSRLAGLGVIENTGAGQVNGAANAWRLTRKGTDVEAAIKRQCADRRGDTR